MKRRHFPTFVALLATPSVRAAAGSMDFQWLDARLRQRVQRGYFDGMGLVIGRGERVLHTAYFGTGGPRRVVHVASMGKWVAAAVVATLVDAGLLDWEDPVRKYLPQFQGTMGAALLRQLLSHTAGYPDYQPAGRPPDDYPSLAESASHIHALAPTAEPGTRFTYGGLAMQVAGRMAEIAAGQHFGTLFHTRLARPLGMQHSGFTPVSPEPGFNPMLGGSFYTTAPDYARFLMMIAGQGRWAGKRVLSEQAVEALQADQVRSAVVARGQYVESARQDLRDDIYGLGLWREEVGPNSQATLLSSPGWAGAYAWVDKRANLWGTVVAKANVDVARAEGMDTFLGSSVYAPMARSAAAEAAAGTAVRRHQIAVPGAKLYAEESGRGEAVILLHGHSFDRRQWAPQIAALEGRWRVIRYDLRGYGRSSQPAEDEPFLHAQDLRALMDQLGLERAHLVGLSLGGFVVTDFIAMHSQRALTATMAGGDLFDVPGPETPWTEPALARRRADIAELRKTGVHQAKKRWLDGLIGRSGSRREQLRLPLWQMINEWDGWQLTHVEPRLLLGRSAPAALATARPAMPVLLIRGALESTRFDIRSWLPQARSVVIADCGHVSNLERPGNFNAALIPFLDEARGPPR